VYLEGKEPNDAGEIQVTPESLLPKRNLERTPELMMVQIPGRKEKRKKKKNHLESKIGE
jgi:hypothetical protein